MRNYYFGEMLLNNDGGLANQMEIPSSWFILPYFVFYFFLTTITTMMWPLIFMEKTCQQQFSDFMNVSAISHNNTMCLDRHLQSMNATTEMQFNNETMNFLILVSSVSCTLSLAAYFVLWKPLLNNCRKFATILPPVCAIAQSLLMAYTIHTEADVTSAILAGVCLPALHCNFQGVFLLYFRLTCEDPQTRGLRKNNYVTFNLSVTLVYLGAVAAGVAIASFTLFAYSLLFVVQFMGGVIFLVYGAIMDPMPCSCRAQVCQPADDNDEEVSDNDDDTTDHSEDEFLAKKHGGELNKLFNRKEPSLAKEGPLIFSQESYSKEVVVFLLFSTFTVAFVADTNISGPYLLQRPFFVGTQQYGLCVVTQALAKFVGLLCVKVVLRLRGLTHGSVITVAALNYIIYYLVLCLVKEKSGIFITMVINVFGSVAVPALLSFVKTNFVDGRSTEIVLEISVLASLATTIVFTSCQMLLHSKTRYAGVAFTFTASVLLVGFASAFSAYMFTRVKDKRRSKEFADQLLNDYQ